MTASDEIARVSVTIPGRVVLAAGSITLASDQSSIVVNVDGTVVEIDFTSDGGPPWAGGDPQPGRPNRIIFRNFDNALGIAYEMPQFAFTKSDTLTAAFVVHAVGSGNKSRVISYTFSKAARG